MDGYKVHGVESFEVDLWLKKKHYAKRIPPISHRFGLYKDKVLIGVITFGPPCRAFNDGEYVFSGLRVYTCELNRLCVEDGLPKNTLSFFVSKALSLLPRPSCVVSYADDGQGHRGYIYQATNWIYTGCNEIHDVEYTINGVKTHSRTITGSGETAPREAAARNGWEVGDKSKKHRYFIFVGTKKDKKKMLSCFKFKQEKYPKGDNTRYDSSAKIPTQPTLF